MRTITHFLRRVRGWLGLSVMLGLGLQPARAIPFAVNLFGDYLGKVSDAENLPSTYEGRSLVYGVTRSEGHWSESGDAGLFKTTFALDSLLGYLELTTQDRPQLSYLALQADDDYVIWDISDWNSWKGTSMVVVNDRITEVKTIKVPFLGQLKIHVPEDITGIALYGPSLASSPSVGGGSGGGDLGLVTSPVTGVPDGGPVLALLAVGIVAAAFMTRRAS